MYKLYSKDNCSWCVKAKALLRDCGIQYEELKLGLDYNREELKALLPENLPLTVPQVFVYNKRIGGYEDLAEYLETHGVMGIKQ
jgi:glutathione-dependent peroxiredoxin